ncbi:MAG: sigma 54-interacting transcriptional regulator [Acidobacteriota bacterium]
MGSTLLEDETKAQAMPQNATEIILESISDGVFTVDHDWRVTSFNRAAEEITGVLRQDAIGRRCCEVFRSNMCESQCALRSTLDTGVPVIDRSGFIVDADGCRIPVSVSTAVLRDDSGAVIGGVETFRDLSVVEELRKKIEGRYELGDMVSRSPLMLKLFDMLPQVASSDSTVLIEGETGTGKELVARALHGLSTRSDRPFVAVNCGALPDTLLESELFGYKAGAFTGASKDKPGRFALAEGGTIFLDEIGDISPALQVRLLRVLQERAYEPLGGTQSVKANVRVLTATNRNLGELLTCGSFRQDLYYRINVMRLELPPLRARREDIPILVEHFVRKYNRLQGRGVSGASRATMAILLAHDYPGNIRELENIIEHAFVLCQEAPIEPSHLPDHLTARRRLPSLPGSLGGTLHAVASETILEALKRNHYNRIAAARELGIHKSTLFRKIRAHGIQLPPPSRRGKEK